MYRDLYTEIADELGGTITFTEEWGAVGFITLPNHQNLVFRGQDIGLNSSTISELMYDKASASSILASLGFNVPAHLLYFSPSYASKFQSGELSLKYNETGAGAITAFVQQYGFPLFVKPNKGSKGQNVVRVDDAEGLFSALSSIFNKPKLAIIQQPCLGQEYRLVVLNGSVMLAYKKIPFEITGDGINSISELVAAKLLALKEMGRPVSQTFEAKLDFSLGSKECCAEHILPIGEILQPFSNNNLSDGSTVEEVTNIVHPEYIELCRNIAQKLGLRFFGLDLMCSDISTYDSEHSILEINDTPGFKNFVELDEGNREKVKQIFKRGFASLSNDENAFCLHLNAKP